MESYYFLDKALLSFSKKDHKNFGKFLQSPYHKNAHSNNTAVKKLYLIIKPYFLSEKKYKKFSWEDSIEKVFLKQVSTKYTSKVKSELLYYILEFIKYESFRSNFTYNNIFILTELQNRSLNEIYEHYFHTKNYKSTLNKGLISENCYFAYKIFQLNIKQKIKNGFEITEFDLTTEISLLDEYYKHEKKCLTEKSFSNYSQHYHNI